VRLFGYKLIVQKRSEGLGPERLESHTASAAFDQSPKKPCLPTTRVKLLEDLQSDLEHNRIVWLRGSPGRGKSAVAMSLCTSLGFKGVPVVSFFFNKNGDDGEFTTTTKRFAGTIVHQLAHFSPEFRDALPTRDINNILRKNDKIQQLQKLFIEPAEQVYRTKKEPKRVVIVLDALEECEKERDDQDQDPLEELMVLVKKLIEDLPPNFVIFISCRHVGPVRTLFQNAREDRTQHNLDDIDNTTDLQTYVRCSLTNICDHTQSGLWPPDNLKMGDFAEACGGLFEIASIRIRRVSRGRRAPIDTFNEILGERDSPPQRLFDEYLRILRKAYTAGSKPDDKTPADLPLYHQYRLTVGILISVLVSMSPRSLANLVGMEVYQIRAVLLPLHPVMEVGDDGTPLRFYHASFREFLLSSYDCKRNEYSICFSGVRHFETLEQCWKNFRASDYGWTMWAEHLAAITTAEALRVPAILKLFPENDLVGWLESMSNRDASRQCTTP